MVFEQGCVCWQLCFICIPRLVSSAPKSSGICSGDTHTPNVDKCITKWMDGVIYVEIKVSTFNLIQYMHIECVDSQQNLGSFLKDPSPPPQKIIKSRKRQMGSCSQALESIKMCHREKHKIENKREWGENKNRCLGVKKMLLIWVEISILRDCHERPWQKRSVNKTCEVKWQERREQDNEDEMTQMSSLKWTQCWHLENKHWRGIRTSPHLFPHHLYPERYEQENSTRWSTPIIFKSSS